MGNERSRLGRDSERTPCHGFDEKREESEPCHGFGSDMEQDRRLRQLGIDEEDKGSNRRFRQDLKKMHKKGKIELKDIYRKYEEERLARIEAIKKETDPWKIVEMAKVHKTAFKMSHGCYDQIKVEGYEEKIAAMKNVNTPTLFILFLYHYPKEKENTLRMDDLIGPRRDATAPYVNDAVRKAAKEALVTRGWALNSQDRKDLSKVSPEMLDWCEKTLEKDFGNFRLRESLKGKTEIDKMSLKLINLFDDKK
jgi:hypothetical protein